MLRSYLIQANSTALELEDLPISAKEDYFVIKKRLDDEIIQAVAFAKEEGFSLERIRVEEDNVLKELLIKRDEKHILDAVNEADSEIKSLSSQYGDFFLKKYDAEYYLSVKKEMDEFKFEFDRASKTEKKALLPRFLALDEKYQAAKNKISGGKAIDASLLEVQMREYDSKLDRAKDRLATAERAKASLPLYQPLSPRPSGSGAVTTYITLNGFKTTKNSDYIPAIGREQNDIAAQGETAEMEKKLKDLSDKVDSFGGSKMSSEKMEVIIEKYKLQSDLEVAKLRAALDQYKAEVNAELDRLREEIVSLKDSIASIKSDAETIRMSVDVAKRARNAAAMNAQKTILITKKLANILKYLSSTSAQPKQQPQQE